MSYLNKMEGAISRVFALVFIVGSMEQTEADTVFVAIGDWGSGTTAQKDVATSMANWMDKNKGDFIITLGDNFYSGVSDTKHKYWEDRWKKVYNQRSLQKTWYVTLGNHDHNRGKAKNQVAFSKVNSKWYLPKNYYSFYKGSGSGKVHFIMLDTTPLVKGDSRQVKWLEDELKNTKGSWIVVCGHHPAFSGPEGGADSRISKDVYSLLNKYKVAVYLAGHVHNLEHLRENGKRTSSCTDLIVSGAGGARGRTKKGGYRNVNSVAFKPAYGFIGVKISSSKLSVTFIDSKGKSTYSFSKSNPRK